MNDDEYSVVKRQLDCLRGLLGRYSGKTIDNVVDGLEKRVEYYSEINEKKETNLKIECNGSKRKS